MESDSKNNKNEYIQILRGLAVCMVFLSHYFGAIFNEIEVYGFDLNSSPFRIIWGGNAAVIIFLTLSGYFLYNHSQMLFFKSYAKSVLKRFIRLYPTYFLATSLGIVLSLTIPYPTLTMSMGDYILNFWKDKHSMFDYLRQFLLIGGFDANLVNPPVWTLINEARFALIAPAFSYYIRRSHSLMLLLLIFCLSFFWNYASILLIFFIGMNLRKLVNDRNLKTESLGMKILLVIIGVLLLDFQYIIVSLNYTCLENIIYIISACGVSLLVIVSNSCNSKKSIPIFLRPLVFLGDISFAFYLIHFIILLSFRELINTQNGNIIYGFVVLIVTIIISYIITRLLNNISISTRRVRVKS